MKEKKIKTFVGQKGWLYCNSCRNRTHHTCKSEHFPIESSVRFEPDIVDEDGTKYYGIGHFYRLWTCNGCEDALLEECWDGCKVVSPKGDSSYSEPLEVYWHPDRTERSVPVKNFANLPKAVANIYYETVFAHHRSLFLLCGMGLRSLVEAICVAQNIMGKTLEVKIEGLKKLLPASTAEKFHALRFIGNQAAHEFKEPQPDDLHLGIEICEDILNFLYELDHRASKFMNNLKSKSEKGSKH
jgi:hypothetical protein